MYYNPITTIKTRYYTIEKWPENPFEEPMSIVYYPRLTDSTITKRIRKVLSDLEHDVQTGVFRQRFHCCVLNADVDLLQVYQKLEHELNPNKEIDSNDAKL